MKQGTAAGVGKRETKFACWQHPSPTCGFFHGWLFTFKRELIFLLLKKLFVSKMSYLRHTVKGGLCTVNGISLAVKGGTGSYPAKHLLAVDLNKENHPGRIVYL